MALRFLAAHCIPDAISGALSDSGAFKRYFASRFRRFIWISLNGDFADIVTYPPGGYRGIIALQMRNHPENTLSIDGKIDRVLETAATHGTLSRQAASGRKSIASESDIAARQKSVKHCARR
jgi:hypothetical protein